jgi:hypothetical protein
MPKIGKDFWTLFDEIGTIAHSSSKNATKKQRQIAKKHDQAMNIINAIKREVEMSKNEEN